ncbi:endonuclease/exonuclease/phosphatase family protein [Halomonas stenophila]|uniref:Endonuclease/exonuclease/phosphatase family metal-dependent hydrolase n=1 Tax=Halomonas stenophila TaxID=795312 RepID=A0A7W5HKM7_9GAMM|nr:endonuclease/exonuclease/phosphatase family protein [Halomonas stenophila]MBB3230188.1 endonuclease/exonuclease/phosphatase family metal-dependent hydrolase [Halomonas stenophila]
MIYPQYPAFVVEDIVRLRRRLARAGIPPRCTDDNFIVGTWNIRDFGDLFDDWTENPDSPKRNLRGLAIIAEIVRHFDVVALQEVKRQTTALRVLQERFLGPHWNLMLTDVTAGDKGRQERQAYLFDSRRISPSGLAGEIVLPPTADGDPQEQFDRTPYLVGFQAGGEHFALLSAHIRYGEEPAERLPELRRLAHFVAREIRDRAREDGAEEANLIVLGDFNIDRRQGNPLFDAFVATGLWVPEALRTLTSTYGTEPKHYDQIAWFRDDMALRPTGRAGKVDFAGAVFQELSLFQMTYRVSDHFPLWVEFAMDRSDETLARTLGVDANGPDPFGHIAD